MKGLALLAGFLAGFAGIAEARMHHPYRGHRIIPAEGAAPLDGFTTPSGAYSFRKLKSTYSGPAIRLRRASDNLETDIGFLGYVPGLGSPWDEAAALAHCTSAANACTVVKWYSQGGAADITHATPANQPFLVFDCVGALPCVRGSVTGQQLLGASVTPATGVLSLSAVGHRTGGIGQCVFVRWAGSTDRIMGVAANTWQLTAATSFTAPATDGVWHAAQGVINGAGSVLSIDGVETAGSLTNSVAAGTPGIVTATAPTVCSWGEAIAWDAYALTSGERAALTANQRSFGWIP